MALSEGKALRDVHICGCACDRMNTNSYKQDETIFALWRNCRKHNPRLDLWSKDYITDLVLPPRLIMQSTCILLRILFAHYKLGIQTKCCVTCDLRWHSQEAKAYVIKPGLLYAFRQGYLNDATSRNQHQVKLRVLDCELQKVNTRVKAQLQDHIMSIMYRCNG